MYTKPQFIKISLLLLSILLATCNNRKTQNKKIETKELGSYRIKGDTLNDSTYCGTISGMISYKDKFFLTDYQNGKIICLDRDLKFLYQFGIKGKGPGEIVAAENLFINNDTIYLQDEGKGSLLLYTLAGSFIFETKLPLYFSLARFSADNHANIYYSSNAPDGPNHIYNLKNKEKTEFGNNLPVTKKFKANAYPVCHLLLTPGNQVLCIPEFYPIVYRYTSVGEIIDSLDLSALPLFNEHIKAIEILIRNSGGQRGFNYYFFNDAYYFKDKLYLMCRLLKPGEPVQNVKSALLELTVGKEMKLNKIFTFTNTNSGTYTSFCIYQLKDKTYLLTFERTSSEFHIYSL